MELLLLTALILALLVITCRRESPRHQFFVKQLQWLECAERRPLRVVNPGKANLRSRNPQVAA